MKLDEIAKVAQQATKEFILSDFDLDGATQLTTAENLPIFHMRGGPADPTLQCYAIQADGQYVSMILGVLGTFNEKTALYIQRTYTVPQYRNRGLVTSLYNALYYKMKYVLVSDGEMSPETISVWHKLAASLPVQVLDIHSRQTHPFRDTPVDQIFNGDKDVRLVLERFIPDPTWIVIPDRSVLLADNVNFTHPDNDGLYL